MAKYIAAISGGPDSMAMLDMFKKHIVSVCHVNYNKRVTAQRDTNIVENYCKHHHLKLEVLNVTKTMYENYEKQNNNFQAVARLIRYDFFLKCAKKLQIDNVLVAHTKDDFLETAMMQKKRGSATLFLGIHNKNTYQSLNVYRPLLNKWKDELITYCNKKHVIFGVDETNDSDLYERNRVRKALSLLSSSAKETEFQRVQCFNKEHRKERRTIHNEFNLWKYLSYDTTVFKDMLSKHKYYVVYIMLKNCDVNTINRDKIQLVIQWIEASHKNTKLRIDNDLYLQKIDDFIKVVKQ